MNELLEHPNWCHTENALEQIDSLLEHFADSGSTTQQGAVDDSILSSRLPIVISGTVNLQLSELIESDVMDRLQKHPTSAAAVAMIPDEDDRLLESLCEAMLMLFPVEPDRRHEPNLPFTWVPALRRSIAESHIHADLQRYLLVDQFHLIHSAPLKHKRLFGRILKQLAALDTVNVIVGVNESSKEEAAELLGFVEVDDIPPSRLLNHHLRPEVELVKLNTLGYRRKRRAVQAGVA